VKKEYLYLGVWLTTNLSGCRVRDRSLGAGTPGEGPSGSWGLPEEHTRIENVDQRENEIAVLHTQGISRRGKQILWLGTPTGCSCADAIMDAAVKRYLETRKYSAAKSFGDTAPQRPGLVLREGDLLESYG